MEEADNASNVLNVYCVPGTVPRVVLTLEEPVWGPFSRDEGAYVQRWRNLFQAVQHARNSRKICLGEAAGYRHLWPLHFAVSTEGPEALAQEEFTPKMTAQIWP